MDEAAKRKILDEALMTVNAPLDFSSRDAEPERPPLWRSSEPLRRYREEGEERDRARKRADRLRRFAEQDDARQATASWGSFVDQRVAEHTASLRSLIDEGAAASEVLASAVADCTKVIAAKIKALEEALDKLVKRTERAPAPVVELPRWPKHEPASHFGDLPTDPVVIRKAVN